MTSTELVPHLFRTEFSKITSVLSRYFGIAHLEIAEDIASDTFLAALNTWTYRGIPENPTGWLYAVARNKARNFLNRRKLFDESISPQLRNSTEIEAPEIDLSDENISDSQLQMLFAICHPVIPAEGQIGLALRILCGLGIDEIANAFLTTRETINKRLFRAREKLRHEKILIKFPSEMEIPNRLKNVLLTLYLLFNEGYYSESNDEILRQDLCLEAMRLTRLLLANEKTNAPPVGALYALMCFHASRFKARKTKGGSVVLYADQDESLWDLQLIAEGAFHLHESSHGKNISRYHLEASIAYWHTSKADTKEKWENILLLYNRLLQVAYSPAAALNRTFALSKVNGNCAGIAEAEKLQLNDNPYYFTLLGELYSDSDRPAAKRNFDRALALVKTQAEREILLNKIAGMKC